MNIKKYLYIGIGVFLLVAFLGAGITAEFKLSNITSDVYGYIEKFFGQWSLALGAAGTVLAAILASLAIYENRRSQKFAVLQEGFSKLEKWAGDSTDMLFALTKTLEMSEVLSRRREQLENEKKALKTRRRTRENEVKKLEGEKNAGSIEATSRLVDARERLLEILKKESNINRSLIVVLQAAADDLWQNWEEVERIYRRAVHKDMMVRPFVQSIGDDELKFHFEQYSSLWSELGIAINNNNDDKSKETAEKMMGVIENLLKRVNELRNRIIS